MTTKNFFQFHSSKYLPILKKKKNLHVREEEEKENSIAVRSTAFRRQKELTANFINDFRRTTERTDATGQQKKGSEKMNRSFK